MKSVIRPNFRCGFIALFVLLFLFSASMAFAAPFPANHKDIKKTITYEQMVTLLKEAGKSPIITVTEEGKSIEGRSLYLTRINRGKSSNQTKILLFAQVHGNEVASKDAMLYMIKNYAENPEKLPEDVDLWIYPMFNPDGAEKYDRRNANNVDLNRDHKHLTQPETRTFYNVVRKINPDISVDCHEYTRTKPEGYAEKGWERYPDIMVDVSNNFLCDDRYYNLGVQWIEDLKPTMERAGHYYTRYYIADVPPEGEIRSSNLGAYDGRNGVAAYGGIGFIIEGATWRNVPNPADYRLAKRVDAYLTVLNSFVNDKKLRKEVKKIAVAAKNPETPAFIPVDYHWANAGQQKITNFEVINAKTKKVELVPTANLLNDRVIVTSVATPRAYVIKPVNNALFTEWLKNHGIEYRVLEQPQRFLTEQVIFDKVKGKEVAYRLARGNKNASVTKATMQNLPAGSIYIPVEQAAKIRVLTHLEPSLLPSGLFDTRFEPNPFVALIGADKVCPIERVMR